MTRSTLTRTTRPAAALLAAALLVTACNDGGDTFGAATGERVGEEAAAPGEQPTAPGDTAGDAAGEAVPAPPAEAPPADTPPAGTDAGEAAGDAVVTTEVAELSAWISASEVAGPEPISELHPTLLHPPGAQLIYQEEAYSRGESIMTDLVVDGLMDAKGVYDAYEQQLLDGPWQYDYIQTEPSEIVEGGMTAWIGKFEDPTEQVTLEGITGSFARWKLDVQVSQQDGSTFVKLWISERAD